MWLLRGFSNITITNIEIMLYKNPISYKDIAENDINIENEQLDKYRDEIEHFKTTAELYISLFANSKRLRREVGKTDNVQLIAIRIFQDTGAALLLALKGLYPQSSSLLRGTLESINLIYDFIINPQHEDLWFDGSKRKRSEIFKASAVRKRVEDARVMDSKPSKELYALLSDFSVHTNMESHLWYIEITDKIYFHWAGTGANDKSNALIISVLSSLAQGLFVLTYENLYAHDRHWIESFTEWKKNHLIFMKKYGKLYGDSKIEEMKIMTDKVEYVG